MPKRLLLVVSLLLAGHFAPSLGAAGGAMLPAFPGAEGYGARASGGRGGRVIAVTNLNDSGPGSLRAAIDETGPRTIVFRVSGNIPLESSLKLRHGDLTIAGQTAPGDGICLQNYSLDLSGASNVIVRYLRVRPGDVSGQDLDAFGGRSGENIIVDHCSMSWSIDECVSIYSDVRNLTVQWCLLSESLYESNHEKGHHGFGGIWGGQNASWHHNLLAHHSSRNPRIVGLSVGDQFVDLRNNVIYNWGYNSTYGGDGDVRVNLINNVYKPGPATRADLRTRIANPSTGTQPHNWWISGNLATESEAVSADNWLGVNPAEGATVAALRAPEPFPADAVTTHTAAQAFELVLQHAGAVLPRRDSLDTRIVGETRTGTASYGETYEGGGKGIIDSQAAVGGWPALQSTAAPADTDGDGMPDQWEARFRLDPADPSDGPADADGDGYTNLEEYLNGTVPGPNGGRLLNISTRARCGTGDAVLVSGFNLRGAGTKRLLIRTVGPELAAFGLGTPTPDPTFSLHQLVGGSYTEIAANDDWGAGGNATVLASTAVKVGAFALEEASASAALVAEVPAGQYTVVGGDATGQVGLSIIEIYDAEADAESIRLVNLSTRGLVGTGDGLMIAGFVISGTEPRTILLRVVGPTLAKAPYNVSGVLANPRLALYRRAFGSTVDELILSNDNWGEDGDATQVVQVSASVGAFALDPGSADSAAVVSLSPGLYTLQARGEGDSSGIVLAEVYAVE